MMLEPRVDIVSLPPATESLIQDGLLHLATAWHFGARRTHFALTRMHLTRGLNLGGAGRWLVPAASPETSIAR
jgi:hypothetical protein